MTPEELRQAVSQYPWFHTIDLGDGITTPGAKTADILSAESSAVFDRIDVRGRSVLDVGAWNGFYTVEAVKRGAARVVALDEYVWVRPEFRGGETFDLVMRRLGLTVEKLIMDVQTVSVEAIGTFDVVLFLGVFYHLIDPIAALLRLGKIANEVLVVESHLDDSESTRPAMIFYPGDELVGDASNWWGPNRLCMEALLRLAGFPVIDFQPNPAPGHDRRGIFHAYKSG